MTFFITLLNEANVIDIRGSTSSISDYIFEADIRALERDLEASTIDFD